MSTVSDILVMLGSGAKNRDTNTFANSFIKGTIEAKHQISKVNLSDSIQGCRGCGTCQPNNHHCPIDDLMQDVYPCLIKRI